MKTKQQTNEKEVAYRKLIQAGFPKDMAEDLKNVTEIKNN